MEPRNGSFSHLHGAAIERANLFILLYLFHMKHAAPTAKLHQLATLPYLNNSTVHHGSLIIKSCILHAGHAGKAVSNLTPQPEAYQLTI
jgi:hypothetical protein